VVGHNPGLHDLARQLIGSGDVASFSYDEFTLGGIPISGAQAYVATGSLTLGF